MREDRQHQGDHDALALHIESPRDRYSAGDDIILSAAFHNQTDRDLVIVGYMIGHAEEGTSLAWLTHYAVMDEAGRALMTSGPIVKSSAEPRPMPIVLAPGQSHRVDRVPISLLEIENDGDWRPIGSVPNRYTVQMIYTLDPNRFPALADVCWSGQVLSNPLDLTVV